MMGDFSPPLRGSRRKFLAFGSRADVRAKYDLVGVVREDFERHEMANVFSDTDKASEFLA